MSDGLKIFGRPARQVCAFGEVLPPRRRVKGAEIPPADPDLKRKREVVDAFFAAARAGDFDALIELLDPDVVARDDGFGRRPAHVRGAQAVAKLARGGRGGQLHPVLVNGDPGVVVTLKGRPFVVLSFTVVNGKIVEIHGIREPERVRRIAAAVLPVKWTPDA